jgi:penicillin-binding protein 1B
MKSIWGKILEIYLNEIYLGQKGSVAINGFGEASYFYFGKPLKELTLSEAAVMAGLIKAPNHYSPYVDKARCRSRRDVVLQSMHRQEWLSEAELQDGLKQPIKAFGFTVSDTKAPYFIDYLTEQLKALYRPENLSSLGLSVYTTLDSQVQMARTCNAKRRNKNSKGPLSSCSPRRGISLPWWAAAITASASLIESPRPGVSPAAPSNPSCT